MVMCIISCTYIFLMLMQYKCSFFFIFLDSSSFLLFSFNSVFIPVTTFFPIISGRGSGWLCLIVGTKKFQTNHKVLWLESMTSLWFSKSCFSLYFVYWSLIGQMQLCHFFNLGIIIFERTGGEYYMLQLDFPAPAYFYFHSIMMFFLQLFLFWL